MSSLTKHANQASVVETKRAGLRASFHSFAHKHRPARSIDTTGAEQTQTRI